MNLTVQHTNRFAIFWCICFVTCYAWLLQAGCLFSSFEPVYFVNKPDLTLNIILAAGLPKLLLNSGAARMVMDLLFFLLPVSLTLTFLSGKNITKIISIATAFYMLVYCSLLSSFTYLSIHSFTAFMLIPLLFFKKEVRGFYFRLHSLRIVFLLIFFSSAVWKIRTGAAFNAEQMSAILMSQHADRLMGSTGSYADMLRWLILHPAISYLLYAAATAAEFSFVAGFFTRKADRFLMIAFLSFLVANLVLMQIFYFTWLPFAGLLWFSKYKLPQPNGT